MKIILISDIHLLATNLNQRKDNTVKTQWEKLDYLFRIAESLNAIVIQAGDFVDSPRSWILTEQLIQFFSRYPKVPTFFIKGQHDIYYRSSSLTTMGVLTKVFPNIRLLTSKPYITGSVALVGQGYMEKHREYSHTKGKFNILAVHKPVTDVKLPYKTSSAEKFLKRHGQFDCIICGDIHKKFHKVLGRRHILNTSSLVRKTRIDSLPSFCILDTKLNTYEFRKVPVEEDVFIDMDKEEGVDFLDEFIKQVKGKSFFKFTPREKVLSVIEKRHKSIKKLALSIMEGE